MGWNKTSVRDYKKMISCVLKNQMLIMEAGQSQLQTYEHTSRYGSYYKDKLAKGINDTANILHMPRKKRRENCPNNKNMDWGLFSNMCIM